MKKTTFWLCSAVMIFMMPRCVALGDKDSSGYHGPPPQDHSYFNQTVQKQLLLYNSLGDLAWRVRQLSSADEDMADSLDTELLLERCQQLQDELGVDGAIDWQQVRMLLAHKRQTIVNCGIANMLQSINQQSKDILSLIATIRASISTFNDCVNRCTKLVGATAPVPSDGHLYVLPHGLTIDQPGLYCQREFIDASTLGNVPTIIIQSEDVTFDLRDNTLIPGKSYPDGLRHGIWVQRSNVTVRGGRIIGLLNSDTLFNSSVLVQHESGARLSNVYLEELMFLTGNAGCGLSLYRVDDSRVFSVRGGYLEPAAVYIRGCNNIVIEHSMMQYGTNGVGFLVNDTGGETSSGLVLRDNMVVYCGVSATPVGGFLIDNASSQDNISALLMSNIALGCWGYGFKCTQSNTSGNAQLVNNFARSSRGNPGPPAGYNNYLNIHADYTAKDFSDPEESFPFGVNIGV